MEDTENAEVVSIALDTKMEDTETAKGDPSHWIKNGGYRNC